MDFFIFLGCLIITYLFVKSISSSRKRRNLPPGPFPLPVIGNLLALGNKPHKSLAELAKIHGPIMTLKLGQVTTIVISSTDLAKEVLQKHDLSFSNRSIPDTIRAMKHNEVSVAWMPISTSWRNLRRICNIHLFSAPKLNANVHLRRKKLQDLIYDVQESCRNGTAVDIGEAAAKTSLNFLSSTIFSVDLSDQSSDFTKQFKEVIRQIMEEAGKPNLADYFPVIRKLDPQGARRRTNVYFAKVLDLFDSLIDQRLLSRKESSCSGPDTNTHDMLDTLIDIMEDDREEIDRNHVLHLLLDLFGGGTDTTLSTVEWAMAELILHPKVLSKAREELHNIVGKGNQIEESDIVKLPYLQAIIKETLRLHPPVPFLLPRQTIEDIEISGYMVPKGSQVFVNVWTICRDPTKWENPDSFLPERFLVGDTSVNFKGRDFELIPFGAGRRICPGLPLADRIVHLIVGSLINMFGWRLQCGYSDVITGRFDMEDKFGLTLQMEQPLRVVPMPL